MLRIRELRLENNLTQKELAEKISSTSKNIWAYENQISIPPLDVLIKLADGRGIHYLSAFPAASPWRQLSPADKLQHRESRERLSVFLLPYPEARSPGFPVSIIPLFPLFARSGRPPPAPSRYIIYYKHI